METAPTEAIDTLGTLTTEMSGVGEAVPEFTQVTDFDTFDAEWSVQGNDIVLHFFFCKDREDIVKRRGGYWTTIFPQALNDSAIEYFQAEAPRVFAEYVPEVSSWYFRARGFATLNPEKFVGDYLEKLDALLDSRIEKLA